MNPTCQTLEATVYLVCVALYLLHYLLDHLFKHSLMYYSFFSCVFVFKAESARKKTFTVF